MSKDLVEAVAAGARARGVGVVDREPLLLDGVDEVDHRATEVRRAHAVGDDLDAAEVLDLVALEGTLVEEQLVAQTGAAAGLDGDAKSEVVAALLVEQVLDLGCCTVSQHNAGGRGVLGVGVLNRHAYKSTGLPVRIPPRTRHLCGKPPYAVRARRQSRRGRPQQLSHRGDLLNAHRGRVPAADLRLPGEHYTGQAVLLRQPRDARGHLPPQRLAVEAALPGQDQVS